MSALFLTTTSMGKQFLRSSKSTKLMTNTKAWLSTSGTKLRLRRMSLKTKRELLRMKEEIENKRSLPAKSLVSFINKKKKKQRLRPRKKSNKSKDNCKMNKTLRSVKKRKQQSCWQRRKSLPKKLNLLKLFRQMLNQHMLNIMQKLLK